MRKKKIEFDEKEVNRFVKNAKEAYLLDLLERIITDLEKIKGKLGI